MYDVTNGDSFANVKRWLQEIESNCEVVNKILGNIFVCERHITKFMFPEMTHRINSYVIFFVPCFFFVVGNKDDDPARKVVITEDAQRFANQMDIQLFETSAKDNKNVEKMFYAITELVLKHKKQQQRLQNANDKNDVVQLGKGSSKKKGSKCC